MAEVGGEWVPKSWLSHSTLVIYAHQLDPQNRCYPSQTHSAIPNLNTPMAIKMTAYQ